MIFSQAMLCSLLLKLEQKELKEDSEKNNVPGYRFWEQLFLATKIRRENQKKTNTAAIQFLVSSFFK